MIKKIEEKGIKPISECNYGLSFSWFVPRSIEIKKTKTGRDYLRIKVIDSANIESTINCWNFNYDKDVVILNKLYISSINYNNFGFSTKSIKNNFRLVQ